MNCRICNNPIKPFMSFGRQPIANGFLTEDQIPDEYFYELRPAFCEKCGLFQIMEVPPPERMFNPNYPFISGLSTHMATHFKKFAASVKMKTPDDGFVVELGCNDGIMLQHFKHMKHLGIEASTNVAALAQERGLQVITGFFDSNLAWNVSRGYGLADIILAANVICHIPTLNEIGEGVKKLLKPKGLFIFEEPSLREMLQKISYDQIYDEHVFMFSATSVQNAFPGLELINVEPQPTHGGSMRYTLAHQGAHPRNHGVEDELYAEYTLGLTRPETYEKFAQQCELSRARLITILETGRRIGKRVVGYGATSKSTTVINYCGITPKHLEYICDTTPLKQGKLSPGAHIPIRPHSDFQSDKPDCALLFAWNHEAEIMEKEKAFSGKWIKYV